MKKFCFYGLLVICLLSSTVNAEELTWGSCTTYAPMPVLFIHGINANALTWEEAIPNLRKYFGYRDKKFNDPSPLGSIVLDPNIPKGGGVTWFKYDNGIESPAKLYLEAFDYGGEDYSQSFKSVSSYQPTLKEIIEGTRTGILKSYYGDNYNSDTNKLILVGYSEGGLIAREYVQNNPDQAKHVKRLITIGTPHYGSNVTAGLASLLMKDPSLSPGTKPNWFGVIMCLISKDAGRNVKAIARGDVGLRDMLPNSKYLKQLNSLPVPPNIEYICLVGNTWDISSPDLFDVTDHDGVVSGYSQRAEKVLPKLYPQDPITTEQTIPWDYIINMPGINHVQEPHQYDKILQTLNGIPDKGTKTYDTPRVTLGTYTFAPGTNTLYSKTPANDFYITGKIYDYLPGSCTVTVEIDTAGNYVIKDKPVSALNMNTETQEEPKTGNKLNAKFNFHQTNPLSAGMHSFRLTVMNPGSVTGTATTKDNKDWIPFEITSLPTPEEILFKVAENFSKIEDMKAKMIDFGTFTITTGTETIVRTFGPTERIFMQKKPDKVKITSVTGTPTTFILNGDIMYLLSEEIGVYSQSMSDVLDIDISGLNLYSSPEKFMKGFNNILKDKIGDIYVLEITPKIDEPHGKTVIYVDYNKGVIMNTEVYDPDEILMVSTEVKEVLVQEDIYIPTKYLETKFLDEITMITEAVFSDIELNTGITDSEFEP
ncbi:MAG: hypothetical protein ABIF11_01500 [Nitrospirota bacterium]